ncbi:MAG: DUF3617 family protein, partial [Burkholderiaceae bacterium]|nr:DUF3617 family protein [Burkholderiaceae bacterium]
SRGLGDVYKRQALSCAAAAPAGAQPRGEEWDYTLTVHMDGMQMPLPATKVCARPDEGNTPPVEKHCHIKERKVSGATTSFRIVCGPPEPGELKGQFTRKGDRVQGRYTMTQGRDTMTVVAVGTRLGACDPSKSVLLEGKK